MILLIPLISQVTPTAFPLKQNASRLNRNASHLNQNTFPLAPLSFHFTPLADCLDGNSLLLTKIPNELLYRELRVISDDSVFIHVVGHVGPTLLKVCSDASDPVSIFIEFVFIGMSVSLFSFFDEITVFVIFKTRCITQK